MPCDSFKLSSGLATHTGFRASKRQVSSFRAAGWFSLTFYARRPQQCPQRCPPRCPPTFLDFRVDWWLAVAFGLSIVINVSGRDFQLAIPLYDALNGAFWILWSFEGIGVLTWLSSLPSSSFPLVTILDCICCPFCPAYARPVSVLSPYINKDFTRCLTWPLYFCCFEVLNGEKIWQKNGEKPKLLQFFPTARAALLVETLYVVFFVFLLFIYWGSLRKKQAFIVHQSTKTSKTLSEKNRKRKLFWFFE